MEGIGGSILSDFFDKSLIDSIVTVSDKDAFSMAKKIISNEGLLVGND